MECPHCGEPIDTGCPVEDHKRHKQTRGYSLHGPSVAVDGPCVIHFRPGEKKPVIVIADPGHGSCKIACRET